MYLLCINLDRLQLLQPHQKENPHVFFFDLHMEHHGWNLHDYCSDYIFIIELQPQYISMCHEECCFINVALHHCLCVVEGEWW